MKKLIRLTVVVIAMALCAGNMSYAQNLTEKEKKEAMKEAEKSAKKTAKMLNKQKWQYSGTTTLEGAIAKYNYKIASSNGRIMEAPVTVDNVKSVTLGEQRARNAAMTDLSREIREAIKGKISQMTGGEAKEVEIEGQVATFESRVAGELKGELIKHFTIYKKNPNGTYDVTVYFTKPNVAESAAYQKQIENNIDFQKAVQDSLKD